MEQARPTISRWRQRCVDAIFAIHVLVFLLFPLGFLIPSRLWPLRIEVHFWYCFSLFLLFYVWGSLWTFKRRDRIYATCVLDTMMQKVRGYPLSDPRNFQHSFVEELFQRLHVKGISRKTVPGLLLICITLSFALFLLKKEGIVLW